MGTRKSLDITFTRTLSVLLVFISGWRFKHAVRKTMIGKIIFRNCKITFIRTAIEDGKSTNKPFRTYIFLLPNVFTFQFRHLSSSLENEVYPNITPVCTRFRIILAILSCRSVAGESGCHAHTPRSLTPVHVEFVGPFTEVIRTGPDVRRFPWAEGNKATQCIFCKSRWPVTVDYSELIMIGN